MGRKPARALVDLLNGIVRDQGGLNAAAGVAAISPSSFSKVASGKGGFSKATAERLEAAYGERYGFTARQVEEWSLGEVLAEAAPDPRPAEGGILTPALRFRMRDAKARLSAEDYDFVLSVLEQQVGMLAEARRTGRLRLPKRHVNYDGDDGTSRDRDA